MKKIKIIIKKLLYLLYRCQFRINNFGYNKNKKCDEEKIKSVYKEKPYCLSTPLINSVECDVSFIIPVYNAEKYIGRCIDNIVQQNTDRKYEIICVDDGSTDKSYFVLKEYEKYPNVLIIRQKNQGASAARNTGILASHGKYICFVDVDDCVHSDFMSLMINKIEEKDSDIVKGNYSIELDGKTVVSKPLNEQNYLFDGFCWGTLYKRDLWKYIRFPQDYWYEDMIVRMILYRMTDKIVFLNKEIYIKSDRSDSEGKRQSIHKKNVNFKCLDHVFLIKRILEILNECNIKNDQYLILLLRDEMGELMYGRIKELPSDIMREAFHLACDLYIASIEKTEGKYDVCELHNILMHYNYNAWVYYCKAQRVKC